MIFGIDVGTTSVAGVAVDEKGCVVATETLAHHADRKTNGNGVDEQDANLLVLAVDHVIDALVRHVGEPEDIGWTGQMHGVVAVNERLEPMTAFVTWRDARRYGGVVMRGWWQEGLRPFRCLSAPGLAIARRFDRCVIDPTFLESWHVRDDDVFHPWIPSIEEGGMLGDNQAGVYAARCLYPGCAVVNLGTSGQLSVVVDRSMEFVQGKGSEKRIFVDGSSLVCRASLVGGQAWAALRNRLGVSWTRLNQLASTDAEVRRCADKIADDLVGCIDLRGVTGLVGVGNALRLNPALREAVERRFGMPCVIPGIAEMAAYGAACWNARMKKEDTVISDKL